MLELHPENDIVAALRRKATQQQGAQLRDTHMRLTTAESTDRRRARFYDTVARYGNPPAGLTHAIRTPTSSGSDWVIWVDLGRGRGEVLAVLDGRGRPDDPYGEAEVHRHLCEAYDKGCARG